MNPIPHMTYQQYRTARKLVHRCCNYDDGNCLVLECVCVQSISYSLICKWFRAAILPLDGILYAALFPQGGMKVCVECRGLFHPGSNRAKYCLACAPQNPPPPENRQRTAAQGIRRGQLGF